MAALTVQQATIAGLAPSTVTPTVTTGDTFANNGKIWLEVTNGSGSSINVTVDSQAAVRAGLAQSDNVVAVAAGARKLIGPFPPEAFTDANGNATVICSAVTTVTIAAIQFG